MIICHDTMRSQIASVTIATPAKAQIDTCCFWRNMEEGIMVTGVKDKNMDATTVER